MTGGESRSSAFSPFSPALGRDRFVLRADLLSAGERHRVWDDEGRLVLLADSPPRLVRAALAVPFASAAFLGIGFALGMLVVEVLTMLQLERDTFGWALAAGFILSLVVAGIASAKVYLSVLGLRPLVLLADDSERSAVVGIRPAGRSLFATRYTVCDGEGNCLARLRGNHLYGLWRQRWTGYRPDQSCWFVAAEDSCIPRVVRSMTRSTLCLLYFAILLLASIVLVALLGHGHLRFALTVLLAVLALLNGVFFLNRKVHANCLIVRADDGEILGKLDRQDKDQRARLNLIADQEHLDRRVAVAVAVLMDER
jgi:hypothetical protein